MLLVVSIFIILEDDVGRWRLDDGVSLKLVFYLELDFVFKIRKIKQNKWKNLNVKGCVLVDFKRYIVRFEINNFLVIDFIEIFIISDFNNYISFIYLW